MQQAESQHDELLVEVAYALPDRQIIIEVKALPGITAIEAILVSGILDRFPEVNLSTNRIGIFGKHIHQDARLDHNDRVEIYRTLITDPKEVRRKRAALNRGTKKGGD